MILLPAKVSIFSLVVAATAAAKLYIRNDLYHLNS